ncbi:gfo/Idh/MocA family oxidoreductase [Maribellus comscasis]|uniref:Gfo/Idh/MocA family oxidoreductase n=1 Tax=Maribellus comscasis TaxID=2681766 RepID=A0A6I6JLT1_9BACT|nr:Gfo/Idh/MocA family oxidoreductase [Maribellus comscasis]QGY43815.1 gfo/Idh/MocA family oxidoreductase [Maribellus comscasis]
MEINTRREFISKSTAAVAGVSVGLHAFGSEKSSRIFGANDKIRVGFIGVGNRGSQLLERFMLNDDVEVAALCDVYEPYLKRDRSKVSKRFLEMDRIPQMGEKLPENLKLFSDYRRMYEEKDIDAVCIATPDHWHALQCIHACEAGFDVYVEKPLTIVLTEGRAMVNAQKKAGNIVQVGLNRRGNSIYRKLAKDIQNEKIGKILSANAFRISNMFPNGIGNKMPEQPPQDFNWDMWLGPRAVRPFQYNIAPYYFRWWSDFSSQMGNWGVHYMDVIRWMIGVEAPSAVSTHGGKYVLTDDRDIPDTMDVIFEFDKGLIIKFSIYEGTSGNGIPGGEVELRGTKGTLVADEKSYEIKASRRGQFQNWNELIESEKSDVSNEDSTVKLIRNFLDSVKSRETPWCTLEDGHRSTSFAHLANIALKTGKRLEWDPAKEEFTNSDAANQLLSYEYRKPWKL